MKKLWATLQTYLPGHKPALNERRRMVRLACRVMVEVRTQKRTFNAGITDISVAGIRLESKDGLSAKEIVAVMVPGSGKGAVKCRVVWTRRLAIDRVSAGLIFEDTDEAKANSWVKDTLAAHGFSQNNVRERRQHLRIKANGLPAYITNRSDDVLCEGSLINIGRGGAQLSSATEVRIGTKCRVRLDQYGALPSMAVDAIVRSCRRDTRSQKYYHGLRFEVEDDPSVLRIVAILKA